jgi:hypothetical protein
MRDPYDQEIHTEVSINITNVYLNNLVAMLFMAEINSQKKKKYGRGQFSFCWHGKCSIYFQDSFGAKG